MKTTATTLLSLLLLTLLVGAPFAFAEEGKANGEAPAKQEAKKKSDEAGKKDAAKKDRKKKQGGKKAAEKKDGDKKEAAEKGSAKAEIEILSVTQHKAKIGGKTIPITAKVGRLQLRDGKGKPQASLTYFAYTKKQPGNLRKRPITFAFNGGPGSASVWLHMGILGPKEVMVNDDATAMVPPYRMRKNKHSLLDVTDVVMIDPVSTGLSKAEGDVNPRTFHGYDKDLRTISEFIERYLSIEQRWQSPKFLMGESYGSTRAAALADMLFEDQGISLNGISMVSSILNFQTINFHQGNNLPYIAFLPSYTATAFYHKKLNDELQQDMRATLDKAEHFARDVYGPALFKGASLSDRERKRIIKRYAELTGLSPDFVRRAKLRIPMWEFAKELLLDEDRTVGRMDSRFKGIDRDGTDNKYEYDASTAVIKPAYTAVFNEFLRKDLNYQPDRKYNVFGSVRPWDYSKFTNRFVDSSEGLRETMNKNPHMKVFIASGYYDLATPYFGSEWTYDQFELDKSVRDNVSFGYYEAGHMMYVHGPSLAKLKKDLVEFYDAATK